MFTFEKSNITIISAAAFLCVLKLLGSSNFELSLLFGHLD